MGWARTITETSFLATWTGKFSGGIDHQLALALTRCLMKRGHATFVRRTYGSCTARGLAHADVLFAIRIVRAIFIGFASLSNDGANRRSAIGIELATYEWGSRVTFGTLASGTVVDNFTKSVLAACSS